MNSILNNGYFLANSDNDGKTKGSQTENYNTIWGLEYFIMNESSFIEKNCDAIIEIMVKSRGY